MDSENEEEQMEIKRRLDYLIVTDAISDLSKIVILEEALDVILKIRGVK